MPESTPETKDYPVIQHFRRKERDAKGIDRWFSYDPKGDYDEDTGEGWPGAKAVFTGVPGSHEVQELLDGAGGDKGPLIREPDEEKPDDGAVETGTTHGDDGKSKAATRRTPSKSTTTEEA